MKRIIATLLTSLSMTFAYAGDPNNLKLEPCINGGVSATGLHVSQEQENIANQQTPTPFNDTANATYIAHENRGDQGLDKGAE